MYSGRAIEAPPLLLVEILSPSSIDRDRGVKAIRYAALGVPHYWIVDLDARALECYRRMHDVARYELVARVDEPAELRHPDWPDLVIENSRIWERQ